MALDVIIDHIERLHRNLETELEQEGTVRTLLKAADAHLFKLEEMVGLPPDDSYAGAANWPSRLAEVAQILVRARAKIQANRAIHGFRPRAEAWYNVRQDRLRRVQAIIARASELYQAVTALNRGVLPPEPV